MADLNPIYRLSNSDCTVHHETNIIHTQLGAIFNEKIRQCTGWDVVVSRCGVGRDSVGIEIKVRGIDGGHFGIISRIEEWNIASLQVPLCRQIWDCFNESVDLLGLPRLNRCLIGTPYERNYSLHVSLVDFEKRSRIGFFKDMLLSLQQEIKKKYKSADFVLCSKDDDRNYYYIIFENDQARKLADEKYGILNIIDYIWAMCKSMDEYGIFDNYRPEPIVTDKEALIKNGNYMAVCRDNPDLSI